MTNLIPQRFQGGTKVVGEPATTSHIVSGIIFRVASGSDVCVAGSYQCS